MLKLFSPQYPSVCRTFTIEYINSKFAAEEHIIHRCFHSTPLKMRHFFVFVLLATFLNLTLEFEMSEQEMKASKGKFCGPHLSDMLSMICESVFNTKQKRNMNRNAIIPSQDHEDFDFMEYPEEPVLTFPFRSKQRAKSMIPIEFRKRSHGVASECCHKPCSLWEMSSYCGN